MIRNERRLKAMIKTNFVLLIGCWNVCSPLCCERSHFHLRQYALMYNVIRYYQAPAFITSKKRYFSQHSLYFGSASTCQSHSKLQAANKTCTTTISLSTALQVGWQAQCQALTLWFINTCCLGEKHTDRALRISLVKTEQTPSPVWPRTAAENILGNTCQIFTSDQNV